MRTRQRTNRIARATRHCPTSFPPRASVAFQQLERLPRLESDPPSPYALARAKGPHVVSVCLPAHNEQATIATMVHTIRTLLVERSGLVDEVVVMDDRSTDGTAQFARDAGARVVATDDVLAEHGPSRGKGDAMWRSLAVLHGDLLVWCDADLEHFRADTITRLVAPLILNPSAMLVKGYFRRRGDGAASTGGRVTELTARPLIEALAPHLAHLREPLGGMIAARRCVMESISMESDYGVDLGILADVVERTGLRSVVEVDLGELVHRHRSLDDLAVTARQVTRVILRRFEPAGTACSDVDHRRPPYATIKPELAHRAKQLGTARKTA
jgi:glucosyl-3-phosphoglycerate synthase